MAVTTNLHAVPTLRESDTVSNLNGSPADFYRLIANVETMKTGYSKLVGRFAIVRLTTSNVGEHSIRKVRVRLKYEF